METTAQDTERAIGCVGTGALAGALARELRERGFPVRAWLRARAEADAAHRRGAVVTASPREAAEGCGIVLALHEDPSAVRQTTLGAAGLVTGLRRDAIYVEMSALDPGTARYLASAAAGVGARFVDAPLLPGSGREGTEDLPVVLVGADPRDLGAVAPVLQAVGCRVIHAGPVGAGEILLAAVATVLGPLAVALREARALLAAGEIASDPFARALETRGIRAPALRGDAATPGDARDLRRALSMALQVGDEWDLPLPVAAVAREALAALDALGPRDATAHPGREGKALGEASRTA